MSADPLHIAVPRGMNIRGARCILPDGSAVTIHAEGNGGAWGIGGERYPGKADGADWQALRLDLTDDVSRMRVRTWLAHRLGLKMKTEDGFPLCSAGVLFALEHAGVGMWALFGPSHTGWLPDSDAAFFMAHRGGLRRPTEVRALATLDPTDPTLLPDGSRRVDALALAAVVRHYAELAGAPC